MVYKGIFSVLAIAAAAAVASPVARQEALTINTPVSTVECQPSLLLFSGGSAPYFLSVLPAGQVSATPIENLPEQAQAGNYTWLVDLPAGTNFTLSIRDSTGALNYAAPVVIQSGSNSTCVNQTLASAVTSLGATAPITTTIAPASTTVA